MREEIEQALKERGIPFKYFNKPRGECIEVSKDGEKYDYWISTGKWFARTGVDKGRGLAQLIRHLTGNWR